MMKVNKLNIAIIAHDGKKADMVSFIMKRLDFFGNHTNIYATGTTGKHVEHAGLTNVTKLNSGPMGGDAEIAAMIVNKQIDGVVFFIDPLEAHPHQVDVNMLLRICILHNTPLAVNYASASLMVRYYEQSVLNKNL
jgi:methylglyoxal synthase